MTVHQSPLLKKRLAVLLFSFFLLAFSLLPVTLAWFTASEEGHNFEGDALLGYFESGDGSQEKPYIIATPKHFYNLAWLQNIGAFEGRTPYLKIVPKNGNVLNMADALMGTKGRTGAIPPIGTKDDPFVGILDGNGAVIQNLWVSTDERDWYERPQSYTNFPTDSGVGLFGNVGFGANISNFFLENVEVTTTVDGDIGILAGYVDGDINTVGIKNAKLSFKDDKACQVSSDFSLIGAISENVVWKDFPLGDGGSGDTGMGGGGGGSLLPGENIGWGGSLGMLDLNKRLSYIIGSAPDVAKNNYTTYSYDHLGFVGLGSGKNTAYKTSGKLIYFSSGTILPLNIDKDAMFTDEIDGNNGSKTTVAYQNATQNETISLNNTGYLVGGGTGSKSDIRLRAYTLTDGTYNGIYKSLGKAKVTNGTFNGENFKMLTITPDGNTYAIKDPYNQNAKTALDSYTAIDYNAPTLGFTQYCKIANDNDTGVRTALASTLQGENLFHGIHFMDRIDTTNLNTTRFDAQIVKNNALTTLTNYEAVNGALNFHVSYAGTITAIAATNFNQSGTHSLFYLYQVSRNPDNSISNVQEIKTIHKNKNVQGNESLYEYNLVNADDSKYTLVYDSSTMNKLAEPGCAYYFEIPVNAGDYAIGCKTGDSAGAYLMYLDIGANGNDEAGNGGGDSGSGSGGTGGDITVLRYLENIDFVENTTANLLELEMHNSVLELAGTQAGSGALYYNVQTYGTVLYADESSTLTLTQKVPQNEAQASRITFSEGSFPSFPVRLTDTAQAALWNMNEIIKRSLPPPRQRAFSLA